MGVGFRALGLKLSAEVSVSGGLLLMSSATKRWVCLVEVAGALFAVVRGSTGFFRRGGGVEYLPLVTGLRVVDAPPSLYVRVVKPNPTP